MRSLRSVLVLGLFCLSIFLSYVSLAQADISGALYRSILTLTNATGSTLTGEQVDFPLSARALITAGNISSDGLNSQMQVGGVDVGSMPPSDRLQIEGAVHEITGAFTDFTSEAQSATANDVEIFTDPITGTQNFYFGCFTRCRIVAINLSAPSDGNYDLAWQYWNGSSWAPHTGVSDGTADFTVTGFNSVSWDMPTDWAERSVEGITSFWTRVQVTNPSGSPPGPVADRIQFETGMWWTYLNSLEDGSQRQYRLFMGGPAMKTRHQIFTGSGGITADDDPTAELSDTYLLHWSGVLNFEVTGGVKCIVCKGESSGDPFRLYISDSTNREITLEVSGTTVTRTFTETIPTSAVTHSLDVSSDGTDLTFAVGGASTQVTGAVIVADTADNWFFVRNDSAVYTERIYIVADASSLAFEDFDTQGDWDTGTLTGTEARSGQYQADLDPWGQEAYLKNFYGVTGTDDGEWVEGTTSFQNTSSNFIRLGFNSGSSNNSINGYFRVTDVDIAQGAAIEEAYLMFGSVTGQTGNDTDTVNLRISAIDEDNASAPGTFSAAEGATRTTAFVDWDAVPHWVSVSTIARNQSPDISSVVQEVVDRPGWESGNSMVFLVEDNGTTEAINTYRNAAPYENARSSVILRVRDDTNNVALADDFIVGDNQTLTQGPDIPGWSSFSLVTHRILIGRACHGRNPFQLFGGSFGGYTVQVQQTVPATASEVWSFTMRHNGTGTDSDVQRRMEIIWLDSSGAIISTDSTILTESSSLCTQITRNGLTAPSGTAQVRVKLLHQCFAGGQSCGSVTTYFDEVLACVAPTAPSFGDSCNRLTNPSFEADYPEAPTWVSPTISPTNVNVSSSSISWDAITVGASSILAEVSTDNQVTWTEVANGESIPGIDPGDDLRNTTLHVRFTLSPDEEHTPIISSLFLVILDDVLDDSTVLFYELRSLPNGTLTDHSPFDNTGTMEFPEPLVLDQSAKTAGAVTPVSGGAGGFPGFGNLPEALEPTRPSIVGTPEQPGGFFAGCGAATNLPLREIVEPAAESLQWDACTLYEVLVLGVSMVVGVGAYLSGGNPILAMILTGAIMFGGVIATVLSAWILITYAIVGITIVAISRNI